MGALAPPPKSLKILIKSSVIFREVRGDQRCCSNPRTIENISVFEEVESEGRPAPPQKSFKTF